MTNRKTIQIVASAMFIALVVVATFINVPFPGAAGGLVHLGTLMMLIIAMRFGKHYGALAGGIGMTIFDVLGGWLAWAPGTFVVRLLIGFVVGLIAHDSKLGQGKNILKNIVAWTIGLVIMVVGYYLYEAIFITTFEAALLSIWGNILQFIIGLLAIPAVFYAMNNKTFDDVESKL
ncbi:hypothetical protein KQ51_01727 [Candidatus Izimaplasma bacterium HR1]|jgi:uncharacterized membrane protein|uniref:ECF transporter S component n=1 Tax=Candidatus Izimoplasma sp. HR1 TaxID=1541959 RepID=UPI0004F6EA5B|nr:hypothetical protein KQ51_01727 [Candidatus Izimaplasma bacterium HR1]